MDPTRNKAARRESTIDWGLLSRARTAEYRRSPRGKCPGLTERQPARGQTVAAGPAPPSRRAISVVAQLKTKTGSGTGRRDPRRQAARRGASMERVYGVSRRPVPDPLRTAEG
jgi:hypothetical protein